MKKVAVCTDDRNGFFTRAKDAARRADEGKAFDGRVTLSFEDPQRMAVALSELQGLRSELLAGAASEPGPPADAEYFQALRSAVAQGLSAGTALSADQVLDRLETKYASPVDAAKMIDAINADNIHKEVNFGRPVGKEKL
jgi:hypothetical protein